MYAYMNNMHICCIYLNIYLPIVPISIGYTATFQAKASGKAHAHANGKAVFGMQKYGSGPMRPIKEQRFDWDGEIDQLAGSFSASLNLYLLPVVQIIVEKIGGDGVMWVVMWVVMRVVILSHVVLSTSFVQLRTPHAHPIHPLTHSPTLSPTHPPGEGDSSSHE